MNALYFVGWSTLHLQYLVSPYFTYLKLAATPSDEAVASFSKAGRKGSCRSKTRSLSAGVLPFWGQRNGPFVATDCDHAQVQPCHDRLWNVLPGTPLASHAPLHWIRETAARQTKMRLEKKSYDISSEANTKGEGRTPKFQGR